MRRILVFPLLVSLLCAQQNPTAPNAQPEEVIFRTGANLVVHTLTVKDKKGNPIEGLTPKDLIVTEDGIVQTLAFLDYQKIEEVTPIATETAAIVPIPRLARTAIAAEKPGGDLKYANRRLLALYFDMSSMPIPDQIRALDAAQKFIKTQMTPADLVAIMVYAGNEVMVHQDFTADREKLLSNIQTLVIGEDEDVPADNGDGTFGQSGGEFALLRTDRQLSALQTAAKMLGALNEKKSLIYFASGLTLSGTDNQAQLRATVNAAARAGVSFFTVDARGLQASGGFGNASRASAGGMGMYTGQTAMSTMSSFGKSQDTLWSLAADTGGKALLDFNDLSMGIVQAQKSITSYYVLGYYATNTALDGKLRKVKITLTGGLTGELEYRDSYYAGREYKKFTTADKERQLEDALMQGDPVTDLRIAMEVNYFQINRAEYFIPITLKVPGNELALAKKGGAEHTVITFIGEIRGGGPVSNIRDLVDIKLSDTTAADLVKKSIVYDTGFTVLPGNYKIKLLARDQETGRIGTFESSVTIPNLNPKADVVDSKIAISSVVLSSQREALQDALYNANKDKDKNQVQLSVNPLVQEGQKLIPSVTRVFSKTKEMHIYLQAYQQGTAPPQPLVAFVTFYRGKEKAFETAPVTVTERVANNLNTMPIKFSFPMDKLQTGEYDLQITVLNPNSQKAAFWQAPVLLIQ
ncbi:MAG: VWA domain-containing protein [Acidobacteriota bacterium]